jgi:hypothetical protein
MSRTCPTRHTRPKSFCVPAKNQSNRKKVALVLIVLVIVFKPTRKIIIKNTCSYHFTTQSDSSLLFHNTIGVGSYTTSTCTTNMYNQYLTHVGGDPVLGQELPRCSCRVLVAAAQHAVQRCETVDVVRQNMKGVPFQSVKGVLNLPHKFGVPFLNPTVVPTFVVAQIHVGVLAAPGPDSVPKNQSHRKKRVGLDHTRHCIYTYNKHINIHARIHSTFNIQHSTFNIQHSTFNIQRCTSMYCGSYTTSTTRTIQRPMSRTSVYPRRRTSHGAILCCRRNCPPYICIAGWRCCWPPIPRPLEHPATFEGCWGCRAIVVVSLGLKSCSAISAHSATWNPPVLPPLGTTQPQCASSPPSPPLPPSHLVSG